MADGSTARHERWWVWLAAAIVAITWWIAWWGFVAVPEEELVATVMVDDAAYFALPARHLWEGAGFSFDGLRLTNGVQALWAVVCVVLAGLISDPTTMLRAMVGLSGLCWFGAAVGLFAWFGRGSRPAGLVAAAGLAFAGVHARLAFQGMENGLHALIGVAVLLAGTRAVRVGWTPPATLALGIWIALFGASRTEGVLLGPIAACGLLFGLGGAPAGIAARLRSLALLAAPGVLLVGGIYVASRVVFDSWLPISGSVKRLLETSWGGYGDPALPSGGGWFSTIGWHVGFVWRLAIAPLREGVPALLDDWTGLGYRVFRNAVWAILVGCGVLALVGRLRRDRPDALGGGFAWLIAAYALVHLVLMGSLLPHFTSYGTWYFATEVTVVWLAVGLVLNGFGRRWRLSLPPLAVLIAVAGLRVGEAARSGFQANAFKEAGEWLHEHTPPGTRIGALSAGFVGWYARGRHVVNLDGLINDRQYLDEYLRPGRFAEYFDDRRLAWFSDTQPVALWRDGISWLGGNVSDARLVPRRYWRWSGDHSYVIWEILPPGSSFTPLGDDGPAVRDRYAELAVAADVHGRFPVVPADELDAHPGMVVARSLTFGAPLTLLHVLADPAELDAIGLTAATVAPDHRCEIEVAPGLRALGVDVREVRRGALRQLAVTVHWIRDRESAAVDVALLVTTPQGDARAPLGDCHGTLPMDRWSPGRAVVETVVVDVEGAGDWRLGIASSDVAERVHWILR